MEEKTIWVHIIHYYWQNENGHIATEEMGFFTLSMFKQKFQ